MSQLPLDDRRIGGGAVAAAWCLVAGLAALTAFASMVAPARPIQIPSATQSQPSDVEDRLPDDGTEDDRNGMTRTPAGGALRGSALR